MLCFGDNPWYTTAQMLRTFLFPREISKRTRI